MAITHRVQPGNSILGSAGETSALPGVSQPRACQHLGLAHDRFVKSVEPSPHHRCYLWQQQERVDRLHQERYCLTGLHKDCPWLMLPRPGARRGRSWAGLIQPVAWVLVGAIFLTLIALLVVAPRAGFNPARYIPQSVTAGPPAATVATPAPGRDDPRLLPADALSADLLTANSLSYMTISIPAAGGAFAAGSDGFWFPNGALAGLNGPLSVAVERRPVSIPVPVAPWQISSHGTIFQMTVKDASGKQITTLPAPMTMLIKYTAVDLAIAEGKQSVLTAGFIIDSRSPNLANPVHFPRGTWVFFPPSVTRSEEAAGTVRVETQVVPMVLGVMTRPYTQLQVIKQTGLYSSFDKAGRLFGVRAPSSMLRVAGPPMQVAGPQIDSRILVLDPQTNNYGYVNVSDVSPTDA